MKNLKKFMSMMIAVVMMMVMTVTAFAADSFNITITGAIKDAKYEAYRVFDVTYDAANPDNVNYSIVPGHDVSTIEGFSTVFTVSGTDTKYVVKAEGKTDADVITWLKNHTAEITNTCEKAAELTNTTGTDSITLDVKKAGYYFINSTLNDKSAVTVDTAHPSVTVESKIENGPTTPEDAKKIKIDGQEVSVADVEVGTIVDFTVTFNATNFAVNDGKSTVITKYTVEDTPNGFTILPDSITVTLDQDQAVAQDTVTKGVTDGKMKVDLVWATETTEGETVTYNPIYKNPTTVTVSYQARLDAVTKATNKATIKYNDDKDVGDDETEVYNYTVDVEKVEDGNTSKKLPGAEFALKNSAGKYYKMTETTSGTGEAAVTTYAVTWVDTLADATTYWTCTEGTNEGTTYQKVEFKGLAAGTYKLEEVTAPKGYNLAADTDVTLADITAKVEDVTTLTVTSTIADKKGTVLPSTGGIGTTLFYVIGAALVLGSGVLMVSKKRMSAN